MSKKSILGASLLTLVMAITTSYDALATFDSDNVSERVGKLKGQVRTLRALESARPDLATDADAEAEFTAVLRAAGDDIETTFNELGTLLRHETMLEDDTHGSFKLNQAAITAKAKEYTDQITKLDRVKAMFHDVSADLESLVDEVTRVCTEMVTYWTLAKDEPVFKAKGAALSKTLKGRYVGIVAPDELDSFERVRQAIGFSAGTLRIDLQAELDATAKTVSVSPLNSLVSDVVFTPAHEAFSKMSPLARNIYFATRDSRMDQDAAFRYIYSTSVARYKNAAEAQYKRAQEAVKVAGQYMSELEKFARELLAMQHAQYDQERISRAPNMTSSESESGSGKKEEAALYATETVAGHKKIETDMQAKLEALQALMKDFTSRK